MAEELTNDIENLEYELGEFKMYLAYATDLDPFQIKKSQEEIEMYFTTMNDTINDLVKRIARSMIESDN